jgi:hypothetical protein
MIFCTATVFVWLSVFLQELEERRQQEEAARHAQQQAAREDGEQHPGDVELL